MKKDYNRIFNTGNGAIAGGIVSIVIGSIICVTNEEFKETPFLENIAGIAKATPIIMAGYIIGFPMINYTNRKFSQIKNKYNL